MVALLTVLYGLFCGVASFLIAITLGHGWQIGFIPVAFVGGIAWGLYLVRSRA